MALGRTVEELTAALSHRELLEWIAFYEREPWGDRRLDVLCASLMALTANLQRRKNGKRVKVEELVPDWWDDKRSPQALMAKLRGLEAQGKAQTAKTRYDDDSRKPGSTADRRYR